MRRALVALVAAVSLSLGFAGAASAAPGYYQSVYCYDTGSYWQAQKAAFPDYYAANDAYYRALYGPSTWYCTG